MAVHTPYVNTLVSDIPSRDGGFLVSPPIAWQTAGEQIAIESGSSVQGHRVAEKGELHGAYSPKLQDTYITGTGSRTGKDFTVAAGTVKDDWVSTRTSKYGLLIPSSTDTWDVYQTTADARIVNTQFVVRRGSNPISNAPTAANYYAYVELAYGATTNYRIAMVWGQPLTLDFYTDGAWIVGADVSRQIPNIEAYFNQNDDTIVLDVVVNRYDNNGLGSVSVKVGGGNVLYHSSNTLPSYGCTRFTGQYGWATYEEYPLRFQPLVITKKERDFGQTVPIQAAGITGNGRSYADPTQTHTASVTGNGQTVGYTLTASLPDAGDGLGSVDAPILSDVTIAMPGVWVQNFTPYIFLPPTRHVSILEVLDDATRTFTSSAIVDVLNFNRRYTGSYGQVAVNIDCGNGYDVPMRAFTGIGGMGPRGIELSGAPKREMSLPCSDNSYKMLVPIGEEICLDGYAWPSAVRLAAECGNVHPQFMSSIPHYVPPGATYDAPFGPAGTDWPGYSFARGSGLNAKYKFLPNETAWGILMQLIQDMSYVDPVTNQAIPFYMGFDLYGSGQFIFAPYNPKFISPKAVYSEFDPSGQYQIQDIRVFNSVYQMRTSLDFQGIDAYTNELLYYHLNMPDYVLQAVGFRFPWLERSAKFASSDYMIQIAQAAAVQASLPTQVVVMRVPYHPGIHAGDVFIAQESNAIGGVGVYYITEIQSNVGILDDNLTPDCYSIITGRNVANF